MNVQIFITLQYIETVFPKINIGMHAFMNQETVTVLSLAVRENLDTKKLAFIEYFNGFILQEDRIFKIRALMLNIGYIVIIIF